jgi:hypothetical protein
LGHKVHEVAKRADGVEFACFCGHSFVRKWSSERKIRHPWTCVFLGHFVSTTGRRFGLSEYMCRNCGHPFLFPVHGR